MKEDTDVQKQRKAKKKYPKILYHLFVAALALLMVYPLIWMVCSSFKETNTIFSTASKLIPEHFTLQNYVNGWKGFAKTSFGTFFFNTLIVDLVATAGTVISTTLVAYSLGRLRFKGRKFLFVLVLLTMMLPGEILMIPQYLWYNKLGWINTYSPLIVPFFFAISGFFVYLISNFMGGIPRELDEAARIDGCSFYQTFYYVILPLVKPALATVAIFSFINNWNNYMGALLYLRRTEKYTASLALKLFCDVTSQSDYGAMFAMATLSLVPIFVIFATMQRFLTEGVSTTGLKG